MPKSPQHTKRITQRLPPDLTKRLFMEPIIYKNALISTYAVASGTFDTHRLIDNAFNSPPKSLVERIDADYPQSASTEFSGVSRATTPIGDEPLLSAIQVGDSMKDEVGRFIRENRIPVTDDECITLCKHQEGSRFLQKRLETCSLEEYLWVFGAVKYRIIELAIDLFGNYVIQKVFDTAKHFDQGDLESYSGGVNSHSGWDNDSYGGCDIDSYSGDIDNHSSAVNSHSGGNNNFGLINNLGSGNNTLTNHNSHNLNSHNLNIVNPTNSINPINPSTSENTMNNTKHTTLENINKINSGYKGKQLVSDLVDLLRGKILILSLHMYGCRVIQKALECVQDAMPIIDELRADISLLIEDQNGNHVVQKCVERFSDLGFLIKEFEANYVTLCNHKYGCRVIQRLFEACEQDCRPLVARIIDDYERLIVNQYGNYVLQHIIEKSSDGPRLIARIQRQAYRLSLHKFASNVIEKCVVRQPRMYLMEFVRCGADGKPLVLSMATDKYANYVVQKLMDALDEGDRRMLRGILVRHIGELRSNGYAKHIIAKVL